MSDWTDLPKEPARKRWVWLLGAAAVIGAGIWLLVGRGDDSEAEPSSDLVTINYRVTGTAKWADVTMETPTGTEQASPDVPMTRKNGKPGLDYTFHVGDFVYISAQNNESLGDITCTIFASDGSLISRNTSSSDYGIATCEGTAR